jgi:SH3-like domain-containing protein
MGINQSICKSQGLDQLNYELANKPIPKFVSIIYTNSNIRNNILQSKKNNSWRVF